jgi:ATP/maltotriose-dependent transcriptional regulator MalT
MLVRMGDAPGALAAGARSVLVAEELGSLLAMVHAYAYHGIAMLLAGEWEAAQARIETALDIARANRVWLTSEGTFLASLAEAKLGLGDADGARQTVDLAVQTTQRTETPIFELHARIVRARVLTTLDGASASGDVEAELERSDTLLRSTGARSYAPFILEERARLATALEDSATAERLNGEALRLYREMGATGHAERLALECTADS